MRRDRETYFETPARAERLQLLLHLVRNAIEPVYLRAPAGAGKRRLVDELVDSLDGDFSVVRIDAGEPVKPIASLLRQLNLPPESADRWPQRLVDDLGDRQVLVVVERTDDLNDLTREPLAPLAAAGVRLLLLGEGGGADGWSVQFVDLPPFELTDSTAFLRSKAGPASGRITDEFAAAAHAASEGLPGPLLDALAEFIDDPTATDIGDPVEESEPAAEKPARLEAHPADLDLIDAAAESPPPEPEPVAEPQRQPVRAPKPMDAEKVMRKPAVPLWAWAAGTVGAVLLLTVLVFQDAINSAIDPVATHSEATTGDDEPADALDLAIPPLDQEGATAAAKDSVPPISLPEIGVAEPSQAQGAAPPADAQHDATEQDPIESATQAITETVSEVVETEAEAREVDPLDAVMSDALAAGAKPAEPVQAPAEAEPAVETQVDSDVPPGPAVASNAVSDQPALSEAVAEVPSGPAAAPQPSVPEVQPEVVEADPAPVAVIPEPPPVSSETEPAAPRPAPVEDRTRPAPKAVAAEAPVQAPQPAPVEERARVAGTNSAAPDTSQGGDAWLMSRAPGRYTLQLVGARQRAALDKFVRDHNISRPYAVFERQMGGSAWYSLVAGDYPDRDAAVAARERLPQALKGTGVWPRTFGSISEAR
jgi:DamX protein